METSVRDASSTGRGRPRHDVICFAWRLCRRAEGLEQAIQRWTCDQVPESHAMWASPSRTALSRPPQSRRKSMFMGMAAQLVPYQQYQQRGSRSDTEICSGC
ncbi:hypothetical protein GN958_ATG08905 [Phytophthora infestans]|uniref:Uncharacterized protein n=1 Tax=Phytophthora infestans TaxID=4787 RepID=A0A8S9UM06_PHYIN|nr:hypothetical protein GN958_ATG08905 [Phytophthora infestans]